MTKTMIIAFTILLLADLGWAQDSKDIQMHVYQTGVIKGSVFDYYKNDIVTNYDVKAVKAISFNIWAGKLYLRKQHKNNAEAIDREIDKLIIQAADAAKMSAKGFCESQLEKSGLKAGRYFVDHFDVQYVDTKTVTRIIYSGNAICLIRRQ